MFAGPCGLPAGVFEAEFRYGRMPDMYKPSRWEGAFLWLMPSVPVVVFVWTFWATLYFMPTMMSGDGDLGRHLTVGGVILDTRRIPSQDLFSHTMAGAPLVPQEWASEVLYALAARVAGLNGAAWLTALVLASTFAALTFGLGRLGVRAPVALAAGVAASVVSALHALPRPHIFTWLFFTIFLLALEAHRRRGGRRMLFLLPLLMVAWANIHGAFISGLVLVLLYAAGAGLERDSRRIVTLLALLALLVAASWINPAGPQLLAHSMGYLQGRFLVDMTVEYQSPDFHSANTWPFAALLLLSLLLVWAGAQKLKWSVLMLLGGWTAFALYSARNIPLYALVAAVVLAPVVDDLITDKLPAVKAHLARLDAVDRRAWGWVWAVVVPVLLGGLLFSGTRLDLWQAGNDFSPKAFPVAAVQALKESPPDGNMFNEFTWGGYMLYRLWPAKRVFIDGQTDFYGETLTRQYLQVTGAEPGWEAILDRYAVRWVITPVRSRLAAELDKSLAWTQKYSDDVAGVWIRE